MQKQDFIFSPSVQQNTTLAFYVTANRGYELDVFPDWVVLVSKPNPKNR